MLEHLRFPVGESLGRRYPELPHPYRNEFQRDRDRVVHCRAFRRLENKTQVFPAGLSDHFRNRLTHTIEVAQIARTVASVLGLDEDLTEALALVHDIGHPPFAHAGEQELDRILRGFGGCFDHNRHALRVVEQLENRYARFPGLNLTFEVREGIVKHSRDLTPGEDPELDRYRPDRRPPLEAQLIDACDEIAYNTADLDDGFLAGLLDVETLREAVPEFDALWEETGMWFPAAAGRVRVQEIVRGLVDHLVSGLIEGTVDAARHSGAAHWDDVCAHSRRIACLSEEAARTTKSLKQVLWARVYGSELVVNERTAWTERIAELFRFLFDHPEHMPAEYLELAEGEPPHRVVADYIAGMTDGFFARTYQQLIG